jgi:subtilisin-like proprotein convertase family protein
VKIKLFKAFLITLSGFQFLLAQTPKEAEQIVSNYDVVKVKELLERIKSKEAKEEKEVKEFASKNGLDVIKFNPDGSFDKLMRVTPEGVPMYYSIANNAAAISTRVPFLRSGGALGLNLNGAGMTGYVWDGGASNSSHQEFGTRATVGDGITTRNSNSFHAIHVTGTVGASGVQNNARGMAPAASLKTFDWDDDESEVVTEALNGMLLSNHSYGVPVNSVSATPWVIGAYIGESYIWDDIAYNLPFYLPVFSAGNDGGANNPNPSVFGFDKLIGNKVAKNVLTVANANDATVNATTGNITSGGTINNGSSQGPADDFRIKPDVTGNGTNLYSTGNGNGTGGGNTSYANLTGTSMASPNVMGTLLLIQQHHNNVFGRFMRAATLKGLACHTATDMGDIGPDPIYGWGYVNAKFAAETITNNGLSSWISEETLNPGQTFTLNVVAAGGTNPLQGTISWTDVASATKINSGIDNETNADLVNDLDIRITQGANTFFPWKLNSFMTAERTGDNNKDNVEKVEIDAPTAGTTYTVTVTHKGTLADGPQKFSLILTGLSSQFTLRANPSSITRCSNAGNAVFPFTLTKTGGANVTVSSQNVPAGATIAISQTSFAANGTFNVTVSNLPTVAAGEHIIDIIATNGTETEVQKIYLKVYHPVFSNPVIISPANNTAGYTTVTNLTWANDPNATSWDLEIATNNTFTTIITSVNVQSPNYLATGLQSDTQYFWRIKPKNSCANGNFGTINNFRTDIINCSIPKFSATDFSNATIASVANSSASVPITVTGGLTIGKISVELNITHTYVQDMTITLTGPASIGSPVIMLHEEECGSQDDIDVTYDDAGFAPACSPSSPAIFSLTKATDNLFPLDGLAADGIWTINVSDPYNGDGGSINSAALKICNKTTPLNSQTFDSEVGVNIYQENNTLIINSQEIFKSVKIQDLLGRNIMENLNVNNNTFTFATNNIQQSTKLVTITLLNGTTFTKKVIF